MRIGIFTNCYHPLVNGVVGAVALLRKGFLELGHEVHLFAPQVDDYRDGEANIHRFPAVNLTPKVKYPVALPYSPRIARLAGTFSLDILHTHHPFVLGPYACRLARRLGIPAVYTFHTQYEQYHHYIPLPGGWVRWATKRQVAAFCGRVDRITTPAQSAIAILQNYGVDRPVRVIPNPIDLGRFRERDGGKIRVQYGISDREKLLINIGRIAPEKNLGLLLRAFTGMMADAPQQPVKLMIVGDGPDLIPLKQQAQALGIAAAVLFTGQVAPEAVPDYLAAADLFVMTSTTEIKPLAQLEAFAAGVPIVAVAAAGANDTIRHGVNGLLVPGEEGAIRSQIAALLGEEARLRQFRESARQTAAAYSYREIAASYLELFTETIRQNKGIKEGCS